jgi:hypothetical protein
MGFLKNESLQVIVDAPRDSSNSFNFTPATTQSMPIKESGLLVKFFIAAKFNHTISSGWPIIQIRRRTHTNNFSQVFSTAMEPRPTGYLNVFEYDVQKMEFDIQHNDLIRVFWPQDTNILQRFSLAYFRARDSSNVMLSIEVQHHTENTSSITVIADTSMITDETYTPINTTIMLSQIEYSTITNDTRSIIIGSLVCTILALILLSIAIIIIVLTYRHHKNKKAPYATQQAGKDFDMDSNQAYTTREEAKHDEAVNCIEMDSNQAYITHSETKFKGEQGAGKKEMEANQAYIDTDTLPTDPNVAYGTVDCIEVDANQVYGTNTVPTDRNMAYGTNTVPMDPNVAYGAHRDPPQIYDYDYVDLP